MTLSRGGHSLQTLAPQRHCGLGDGEMSITRTRSLTSCERAWRMDDQSLLLVRLVLVTCVRIVHFNVDAVYPKQSKLA